MGNAGTGHDPVVIASCSFSHHLRTVLQPRFVAGPQTTMRVTRFRSRDPSGLCDLVLRQPLILSSVAAGVFRTPSLATDRRGCARVTGTTPRSRIGAWVHAVRGAPAATRKGAPANAHPRCWHLSTYSRYAFEAPPSGLDACARADTKIRGRRSTSIEAPRPPASAPFESGLLTDGNPNS